MERLELEVNLREGRGKGVARKLRARGRIPGVVYGSDLETTAVEIEQAGLDQLLSLNVNALIDLQGPKPLKGKRVLVKHVQRDPVSRRVLHCDFFAVDLKKKIHVAVPVRLEGRAQGVEMGGVLEPLLREIEVACLPLSIPEAIQVNVEELGIGESIHVSQLQFPEGVEPLVDPEIAVVNVGAPRVEEEEVPAAEEAVPEEGAEPAEGEEKTEGPEAGE